MNYTANKIHWTRGAIVIHDADAKQPKMLMRVIGWSRKGFVKTQYIDRRQRRTVWENLPQYLHDPMRFGIRTECAKSQAAIQQAQYEFECKRNESKDK